MSGQESLSIMSELTQFAFAVLAAKKGDDLGALQGLLEVTAKKIQLAKSEEDTLIDEKMMVALYPGLFPNTKKLQNDRANNVGPPFIKVRRRVYYRPRDVDGWILEQERLTEIFQEAKL